MAKLYEHLDIGVIAELVPDVRAGLDLIQEDGPDRPLRIRREFQEDVGVPLLRTVHAIMWTRASRATGPGAKLPRGFERSWNGNVTAVLRDDLKVKASDKNIQALASQVVKLLAINGMAENHGGVGTGAFYWLRPWDPKIEVKFSERKKDRKLDHAVAKQEKANPPKPVKTSVDLSVIPKPKDATPEAVLAYVEKLVAAHHRLETMYQESQEEVATLKTQIEEAGAVQWEIGDALGEIVGS